MNKLNERVKELSKQAEIYALTLVGREDDYVEVFEQKFAELLVRECAEIANNKMKDLVDSIICEEKIDTEVFVGNKIKEHFGVE